MVPCCRYYVGILFLLLLGLICACGASFVWLRSRWSKDVQRLEQQLIQLQEQQKSSTGEPLLQKQMPSQKPPLPQQVLQTVRNPVVVIVPPPITSDAPSSSEIFASAQEEPRKRVMLLQTRIDKLKRAQEELETTLENRQKALEAEITSMKEKISLHDRAIRVIQKIQSANDM